MLLPTINTSLRRALEQWFETEGLRPVVAGEFEDPALLNTFGERGRAVFPAPTAIEGEVLRSHRVAVVGRTSAVRERYYAISVERRLKHAGVAAITSAARTEMFADHEVDPRVAPRLQPKAPSRATLCVAAIWCTPLDKLEPLREFRC